MKWGADLIQSALESSDKCFQNLEISTGNTLEISAKINKLDLGPVSKYDQNAGIKDISSGCSQRLWRLRERPKTKAETSRNTFALDTKSVSRVKQNLEICKYTQNLTFA